MVLLPSRHRYYSLAILSSAYLLCYVDRLVISTAIPFIADDFHVSSLGMGGILSAFFVGYTVMQIPGGLIVDRYGPRVVLLCSVAWWTVMTGATGNSGTLGLLLAVRILFGIGEGAFPPAAFKAISIWFSHGEKGRASGLQLATNAVGAALAPLLAVAVIETYGWRMLFYLLILPGIVVFALLSRIPAAAYRSGGGDSAAGHLRGNAGERRNLFQGLRQVVKVPSMLWCAVGLFLTNAAAWGLINWLPTYLLRARGFSLAETGVLAALSNASAVIGYLAGGYWCDKHFAKNPRISIVLCSLGSGLFTYLAAVAPTGIAAVAYLVVVFVLNSAVFAALLTLTMIHAPSEAVGSAIGVVNTAAQLAGIAAPVLIGYLLSVTGDDFRLALLVLVGVMCATVLPVLQIRFPATASMASLQKR